MPDANRSEKMNERIPVTILTGFLGAGKTTILANLLKKTPDKRFAVLVNEFGEISVDDTILKNCANEQNGEFHKFANGLLAYSGDQRFAEMLLELQQRKHLIDHILIETSGLAVPSAVIETLQAGALADSFVLDATLTIVDTPWLLSSSREAWIEKVPSPLTEVFCLQLECADVVVLNKIDGFSEDELLNCEELIRTIAPSIRFIELAHNAQIDLRVAMGLRLNESTAATADYRVTALTRGTSGHTHKDGHNHSGLGPHEHGILTHQHLHEHDPGWISFTLHSHAKQKQSVLTEALARVADTEGVLRMKGSVLLDHAHEPVLVQGVRGRIEISASAALVGAPHIQVASAGLISHLVSHHDHKEVGHDDKEHDHGQLVFIGYHLDRHRVASKLSEYTGTNWH
jgi:cobalamin biosynthesis protein CobW